MDIVQRRLAHEREQYQAQLKDIKSAIQESINSMELQMGEIRYLKGWSQRLNEVLTLQSMVDIQEEIDKHSISLVG